MTSDENTDDIRDALAKLDVKVDQHWTDQGLPRLEVLHQFTGDSTIRREQVTNAAPEFTRSNPEIPKDDNDLGPVSEETTKAQLEEDAAELEELKKKMTERALARDSAQRDYLALQEKADDLIRKLDSANKEPPIVNIKKYLAAQQARKYERAADLAALADLAKSLKEKARGTQQKAKAT
jgi:low affinity Fe/Cu permease